VAQFTYTTISGAYTDCEDNQVLLINTVNDIKTATFRGRLRGAPDASDVFCNESALISPRAHSSGSLILTIFNISSRGLQRLIPIRQLNWSITTKLTRTKAAHFRLATGYVGYVDPGTGFLRSALTSAAVSPPLTVRQ